MRNLVFGVHIEETDVGDKTVFGGATSMTHNGAVILEPESSQPSPRAGLPDDLPVMAGLVNLQRSHGMVGQEGGQMN